VIGKNETIEVNPAAGVSAAKVAKIKEHIEFSLEYYEEKGFTRGPKTAAGNKIKINVMNGTSTETVGSASTSGVITIKIGTTESDIDLKYVCEHELMHLFQYQTETEGGDTVDHAPVKNKWWIEGQATYWGIESTKANFNLTNAEIQDEFDRVGDHNWNDHYTDLNRSIFIGWGGSYSDYMGSYLFMKFIREKYGEDKLKEAFDKAKDNYNNDSKDVSPEDAIAEACGKTWDQLVAEFAAWMMTDAISSNGVPERVGHVNVTYTNDTVSDSLKVGPYASGVERIKVNGSQPFQIDISTPAGSEWKITIIYVYEDGSREQAFNTPYTISTTRALVGTDKPATVNMTVSPIENSVWNLPKLLTAGIAQFWQLPPTFYNYTDPLDWSWSRWFWFTYNDNTYQESIVIDPDVFVVDSFFDVYVKLADVTVTEYLDVSAGTPIVINWDLTWGYGDYVIEIRQSTWDSWVNGTIIWNHYPKPGRSYGTPDHLDIGECRAADSNEWDLDSHWYDVLIDDAMEYLFQIQVDAGFELTANWTMEVYNTTHPGIVLRTTEGYYFTGEWPRYLVLPVLGDPDYSGTHEYILRLRYVGGGIGNISLLSQPLEGSWIDNPLWHTILTTEYFGVSLPYTYTGSPAVYINTSVTIGLSYNIKFNASTNYTYARVWDGLSWTDFFYYAPNDWFSVSIAANTDTLLIEVYPELSASFIYFFWSNET
ncbi:MAG: hypothetical protein ACW992_06465, partial [Candidatus Thorarchaeota archaeon]|jgi:hypothetical protein